MHDFGGSTDSAQDSTPSADSWHRTIAGLSRTVSIDRSWWSWGAVHSGHIAALGLETMSAAVGELRPVRAFTATFPTPADDRPLTLTTTMERVGGTSSVTSLRADQSGDVVMIAMATFGVAGTGPDYAGLARPPVPGPDECPRLPVGPVPYRQHLETRAATEDRVLGGGPHAGLTAWVRFADGRAIDAAGVTMLLDGLAPGIYATLTRPVSMPLLQLSVEFAADLTGESLAGWILIRIRTEHAGSGWATDDSTAWAEDGRLLARSRHCRRFFGKR